MPKSRVRKTVLDRQLKAEARAAARARLSRTARIRKTLGWPVCAAGAVLFVGTYVANFAGVVLPWDPHHFFGQVAGLVLIATGLVWATR